MVTVKSLWHRHSVLKSGTGQSSFASFSRLATSPVVWRRGSPKSAWHASGRSGSPHPRRWPNARVGHSGRRSTPSRDRTRSITSRAASGPHWWRASWSCGRRQGRACSSPATNPLSLQGESYLSSATEPFRACRNPVRSVWPSRHLDRRLLLLWLVHDRPPSAAPIRGLRSFSIVSMRPRGKRLCPRLLTASSNNG